MSKVKGAAKPFYTAIGRKDDGIVDEVAIERLLRGHKVPLTSREIGVVVERLAGQGATDLEIADLLGRPGESGKAWVYQMRRRRGIKNVTRYDDASLWRMLVDTAEAAKATAERKRAAGMIVREEAA